MIYKHYTWQIEPMGAPRMTRADSWKKRPVVLKYHAFRDAINHELRGLTKQEKDSITTIQVDFYLPIPKSWSNKKRLSMNLMPHKQKPDIDNLQKALLDSIFREGDDCQVFDIHARKFWREDGGQIVMTI